jgi:hypothetical protein
MLFPVRDAIGVASRREVFSQAKKSEKEDKECRSLGFCAIIIERLRDAASVS